MNIWIDAQSSPALAMWITDRFAQIDATAVRDIGLRDAEDAEIFFAARTAFVTVMTKDSDFVDLQVRLGIPPKIIWLTCGNTSNKRLKEILTLKLVEAITLLESGEKLVEISGR